MIDPSAPEFRRRRKTLARRQAMQANVNDAACEYFSASRKCSKSIRPKNFNFNQLMLPYQNTPKQKAYTGTRPAVQTVCSCELYI
jgi:hypothetical protein